MSNVTTFPPAFRHQLERQMRYYTLALHRLRAPKLSGGRWVGCAFPLPSNMATEQNTHLYGLPCVQEARAYLSHPILRRRLEECTCLLLERTDNWVHTSPVTRRIHSCITLFAAAAEKDSLFQQVLDQRFNGRPEVMMQARINCTDGFARNGSVLVKCYHTDENIVIPEGITAIGSRAFVAANRVRSVTLPDSVTAFFPFAFGGCSSLEHVPRTDNIQYIGDSAFWGCRRLADKQGFVIIKGCLYDYIGNNPHVVIPQGVTAISQQAFLSHNRIIESVTIPEGLQQIHANAFPFCHNLRQVYLPKTTPTIAFNAFKGCELVTLYQNRDEEDADTLGEQ